MVGSHWPRALCWGVWNLTVGDVLLHHRDVAVEGGVRAVDRVALTVLSFPVMIPVLLSMVADWTLCFST